MIDQPTTTHSQSPAPAWGRRLGLLALLIVVLGISIGYLLRERRSDDVLTELVALALERSAQSQIVMPDHYTLPVTYGDIGPQLLDAGAIDYEQFAAVYERAGQPLTEEQQRILVDGSDEAIVVNRENAYFLLNLFWAFGLANQNRILDEGPLMQYAAGDISSFASTGGWTLGTKPATELYSSAPLLSLNSEQQARLETVAEAVYRPCCNNHTAFADCNHGMAMLGLLEALAAHDAPLEALFETAKYLNAFWFPQQSAELTLFFQAVYGQDFASMDARQAVGSAYFSATGFRSVHQFLADNNLLQQSSGGGNSCGV